MRQGDGCYMPAGVPYRLMNVSDQPATFVFGAAPGLSLGCSARGRQIRLRTRLDQAVVDAGGHDPEPGIEIATRRLAFAHVDPARDPVRRASRRIESSRRCVGRFVVDTSLVAVWREPSDTARSPGPT